MRPTACTGKPRPTLIGIKCPPTHRCSNTPQGQTTYASPWQESPKHTAAARGSGCGRTRRAPDQLRGMRRIDSGIEAAVEQRRGIAVGHGRAFEGDGADVVFGGNRGRRHGGHAGRGRLRLQSAAHAEAENRSQRR